MKQRQQEAAAKSALMSMSNSAMSASDSQRWSELMKGGDFTESIVQHLRCDSLRTLPPFAQFRICRSGDASTIMSDAPVWCKDVRARRSSFIDTALSWSDGEREVIVRFMFARLSNPVYVALSYIKGITENQCFFTDIEIVDAVTWRRLFEVAIGSVSRDHRG